MGADSGPAPQNPEQADSESDPELHQQTQQRSKMERLREVRDAAKKKVTCTCTKVTWRIIRLGLSLWQIGDMVSDIFQTRKFYHLSTCTLAVHASNFSTNITEDCIGS